MYDYGTYISVGVRLTFSFGYVYLTSFETKFNKSISNNPPMPTFIFAP